MHRSLFISFQQQKTLQTLQLRIVNRDSLLQSEDLERYHLIGSNHLLQPAGAADSVSELCI